MSGVQTAKQEDQPRYLVALTRDQAELIERALLLAYIIRDQGETDLIDGEAPKAELEIFSVLLDLCMVFTDQLLGTDIDLTHARLELIENWVREYHIKIIDSFFSVMEKPFFLVDPIRQISDKLNWLTDTLRALPGGRGLGTIGGALDITVNIDNMEYWDGESKRAEELITYLRKYYS